MTVILPYQYLLAFLHVTNPPDHSSTDLVSYTDFLFHSVCPLPASQPRAGSTTCSSVVAYLSLPAAISWPLG
ncbi:hypothetical protein FJTKL_14324 [Diaporthe vaccinii]|uniref:Uncharacterized protein n=1 Tax=Diaporthe vaccinii TaxID=105482 RepID=A0ABR4E872_9PEZI